MRSFQESRRFGSLCAFFVAVVLFAAACSGQGSGRAEILFVYEDIGASGFIDQTVELRTSSRVGLLPMVEYTALDADGNEVPGIVVGTAFGSDRGLLLIAEPGAFDVLNFNGERVSEVVDVSAVVVAVEEVPGPTVDVLVLPEVLWEGVPVTKFDVFDEVVLTNESDVAVAFRVVCLVYDSPAPGHAQQAEEVSVVVDRVEVPAGGIMTTAVLDSFRQRTQQVGFGCSSLTAHQTS